MWIKWCFSPMRSRKQNQFRGNWKLKQTIIMNVLISKFILWRCFHFTVVLTNAFLSYKEQKQWMETQLQLCIALVSRNIIKKNKKNTVMMFWHISLYLKSFRVSHALTFLFTYTLRAVKQLWLRDLLWLRYLRIPAWLEKAKGRLYYWRECCSFLRLALQWPISHGSLNMNPPTSKCKERKRVTYQIDRRGERKKVRITKCHIHHVSSLVLWDLRSDFKSNIPAHSLHVYKVWISTSTAG